MYIYKKKYIYLYKAAKQLAFGFAHLCTYTYISRTREEMCVTDNKPTGITRNGNYYVYANERNFLEYIHVCTFGWGS